jgi:hypothetical protein
MSRTRLIVLARTLALVALTALLLVATVSVAFAGWRSP